MRTLSNGENFPMTKIMHNENFKKSNELLDKLSHKLYSEVVVEYSLFMEMIETI
jgi:hypothetical protein